MVEMVLVLAIIVITAAISIPSLQDMYANYVQEAGADAVRAAWSEARARAIEQGRPYRFAIVPSQGNFRVAPDSPEFWGGGDAPPTAEGGDAPWVFTEALPRGIRFADAEALGSSVFNDSDTILPPESIGPDQWMPIVTFLPDGSVNRDVEIVFQSRSTSPLQLRLRAMTGTVTTTRLAP